MDTLELEQGGNADGQQWPDVTKPFSKLSRATRVVQKAEVDKHQLLLFGQQERDTPGHTLITELFNGLCEKCNFKRRKECQSIM